MFYSFSFPDPLSVSIPDKEVERRKSEEENEKAREDGKSLITLWNTVDEEFTSTRSGLDWWCIKMIYSFSFPGPLSPLTSTDAEDNGIIIVYS